MQKKTINILAINPGTKYLGIAVFRDADLRDWAVRSIVGKWSKSKLIKIQSIVTDLISRYQPDVIALKTLDPSRRSRNLNSLICEIRQIAKRKGIGVQEYSIEDLKRFYSPEKRINKRQLAEIVATEYPALFNELNREEKHKNIYFGRMFEAVALGSTCPHQVYQ